MFRVTIAQSRLRIPNTMYLPNKTFFFRWTNCILNELSTVINRVHNTNFGCWLIVSHAVAIVHHFYPYAGSPKCMNVGGGRNEKTLVKHTRGPALVCTILMVSTYILMCSRFIFSFFLLTYKKQKPMHTRAKPWFGLLSSDSNLHGRCA